MTTASEDAVDWLDLYTSQPILTEPKLTLYWGVPWPPRPDEVPVLRPGDRWRYPDGTEVIAVAVSSGWGMPEEDVVCAATT